MPSSANVTDAKRRCGKEAAAHFRKGQAAAKVDAPRQRGGATQPSTLPEAKRDQTETAKEAAIVTTTSRSR
jgi:hypothetical protein